jgi:tetratricopeptide (TPR) repeat protein
MALLMACAYVAQAGPAAKEVLSFADHLYAQQDYYRAITEYKRFLFLYPTDAAAPTAEYQIGMAYLNGGRQEAAMQVFSELADKYLKEEPGRKALLMVAESYSKMEKHHEAQAALEQFLARYPDDERNDAVRLKIGWYSLCQGETEPARERFRACPAGSPRRGQAERLTAAAHAYDALPRKSPLLAGCLSAALPGAGQVYTGRPRDGLLAFMLSGGLAWAAVEAFDKEQIFAASLFAMLDLSWYTGNIYNAVSNAHKSNRRREQEFLNDVDLKCALGVVQAGRDGFVPAIALRVSF